MKQLKTKQSLLATGAAALVVAGGTIGTAQAAPSASVQLNGQPLATSVAPVVMNGRTLVPLRDIFEALGATVQWNAARRDITATKGQKKVYLQIGNKVAQVDGNVTMLDQAATLYKGSTLVPMRFVSEALGARVMWNGQQRIASIFTPTTTGSDVQAARTITVPADVIAKVKLDKTITSANARVGDPFTATVVSVKPGDSEFPAGSKLSGVVTDARAMTKDTPGVLGLDFRTLVLPDGARYSISGALANMDNDSITSSNGRITAKSNNKGTDFKIVGIGAAAGFVLGKVLDQNKLLTAVLGAAGGYLYDKNKNKDEVREAVVGEGTEFGVRLNRAVTYTDSSGYSDDRASFLR